MGKDEEFRATPRFLLGAWDYVDHMERIQIEDEYKNVRVLTYDDILARAKSLALL